VLIWPEANGFLPKLTDFGLATGTGSSTMRTTQHKGGAGTLAYKAPEAFDGKFTTSAEVYAFGVIGFEVLTGAVPWADITSEAQLMMTVFLKKERPPLSISGGSAVLVPLVERCWAQEPHYRPSFAEVCEDKCLKAGHEAGAAGSTYFLSYKQQDLNDGAVMMMYTTLTEKGQRAWLDKYADDRSEEGMVAGVSACDVFLCCISEKYFTSYFCCLEVHTAIRLRKPILVVFNQSKVTVQTALGWVPPVLKPLLNNELLPLNEDVQMMLPCVDRLISAAPKPFTGELPSAIGGFSFGASTKTSTPDSLPAAIDSLLSSLSLGVKFDAAAAWCIEKGAEDARDLQVTLRYVTQRNCRASRARIQLHALRYVASRSLQDGDYAEQLVEALDLPEMKARKTIKAIKNFSVEIG
jgi:serine/threonine protein kinase